MEVYHAPHFEHEFTYAPIYFYFLTDQIDDVIRIDFSIDKELKFSHIKDKSKSHYTNKFDEQPGCGYGFISYTSFNKMWVWHIDRCPPERYWRFATSDPYMISIESRMR